jgi:O-antigen ligase
MILTALDAYGSRPGFWPIGLGASAFNAYYMYRDEGVQYWYPHNIVVEAITEYGVPGMLLLGSLMWLTFRNCLELVKLSGDDRARRSTATVLLGIVTFNFLMCLKQGALLTMPPLFMFCLIVARVAKNEEAAAAAAEYEPAEYFPGDEGFESEPEDEWASEAETA